MLGEAMVFDTNGDPYHGLTGADGDDRRVEFIIPAEHRRMVVPEGVEGGAAPAEQRLVDHIVMGEGGDMKRLEGTGQRHVRSPHLNTVSV